MPYWLYTWINGAVYILSIWIAGRLFIPNSFRRSHFYIRIIISCLVAVLTGLAEGLFFINGFRDYGILFYVSWYFIFCVAGLANCLLCYKLTLLKTLYYLISIVLVKQSCSRLLRLTGTAFDINPGSILSILLQFYMIPVYALVWVLVGRKIKKDDGFTPGAKYVIIFSIMLAIALLSSLLEEPLYKMYLPNIIPYALLCVGESFFCLLALALQYWFYLDSKQQLEMRLTQEAEKKQLQYYEKIEKLIDDMNIKIHDLKHQSFQLSEKTVVSSDVIHEIQKSFDEYRTFIQTGEKRLDVILTEKYEVLTSNGIKFSYAFDGGAFKDFTLQELNRLFGNAIDNALRYLIGVEEENRYINITGNIRGVYYRVQIVNYFKGELKFDKTGLPKTTKRDTFSHGQGIKSMRQVLESHNGNLTVEIKDDKFILSMIFQP